ncbi:hypothetical protein [Pelosinus sp. sgz500959]
MSKFIEFARKIAYSELTVLIVGESGILISKCGLQKVQQVVKNIFLLK